MKATPEILKLVEERMKYATVKDVLTVALWEYFNPQKCERFILALQRGMHWKAAMSTAREFKTKS